MYFMYVNPIYFNQEYLVNAFKKFFYLFSFYFYYYFDKPSILKLFPS